MSWGLVFGWLFGLILFVTVWLGYLGRKYNGADWGHPVTNIIDGLIRLLCRRYHRLGSASLALPDVPRLILIANHISGLDPFLLLSACDRPIRFMIAKEEYQKPILRYLFRAAGCIPVDRKGRVEKAFRTALRAVEAGELVALFPQGGIHLSSSQQRQIKAGVCRLSQLTGSPVLAVRMAGISVPGSVFSAVVKRGRAHLEVHPLLSCDRLQHPEFRRQMAAWLLFKCALLRLD